MDRNKLRIQMNFHKRGEYMNEPASKSFSLKMRENRMSIMSNVVTKIIGKSFDNRRGEESVSMSKRPKLLPSIERQMAVKAIPKSKKTVYSRTEKGVTLSSRKPELYYFLSCGDPDQSLGKRRRVAQKKCTEISRRLANIFHDVRVQSRFSFAIFVVMLNNLFEYFSIKAIDDEMIEDIFQAMLRFSQSKKRNFPMRRTLQSLFAFGYFLNMAFDYSLQKSYRLMLFDFEKLNSAKNTKPVQKLTTKQNPANQSAISNPLVVGKLPTKSFFKARKNPTTDRSPPKIKVEPQVQAVETQIAADPQKHLIEDIPTSISIADTVNLALSKKLEALSSQLESLKSQLAVKSEMMKQMKNEILELKSINQGLEEFVLKFRQNPQSSVSNSKDDRFWNEAPRTTNTSMDKTKRRSSMRMAPTIEIEPASKVIPSSHQVLNESHFSKRDYPAIKIKSNLLGNLSSLHPNSETNERNVDFFLRVGPDTKTGHLSIQNKPDSGKQNEKSSKASLAKVRKVPSFTINDFSMNDITDSEISMSKIKMKKISADKKLLFKVNENNYPAFIRIFDILINFESVITETQFTTDFNSIFNKTFISKISKIDTRERVGVAWSEKKLFDFGVSILERFALVFLNKTFPEVCHVLGEIIRPQPCARRLDHQVFQREGDRRTQCFGTPIGVHAELQVGSKL
jgi:hypothetical protein